MTPVSSPIREFGILKVEHGDVRVAAWAAPWRTVRPALTSRTTSVERKPGKNSPRSRSESAAASGSDARASETTATARFASPREHTRSGPSGGLPRARVKVESTAAIGPCPGELILSKEP